MPIKITCILMVVTLLSCTAKNNNPVLKPSPISLAGTWQLIKGTVVEKSDTVITDYTKNISFIKIINGTHFAFLQHDRKTSKDSTAVFAAGGGTYSLRDNVYTEHLEYCSDRKWEDNNFTFTVTIKNDTLIQTGVEKIASAGITRINTEKYIRVKK